MEDYKIIELYWERSEMAIAETQNKYGNLCRYISCNILSDREDADECVNDTYLTLWNTIPPQRPNLFSAYIGKITRNLALKKFEYNTAQKRNPEAVVSLSELEDCISGHEMPHEDEIMFKNKLNTFLRSLDYEARNVFLRRYWFFDSVKEIAERFDISESKTASMLMRTRNKLRDYLVTEGFEI